MSDAIKFAKERQMAIGLLEKQWGFRKINLSYGDGENEGIWCAPITDDDVIKMDNNNSYGEQIRVYLVNMPLGWGGRCWGAEVIGVTRGSERPVALPADQSSLDDDTKLLYDGFRQIKESSTSENP